MDTLIDEIRNTASISGEGDELFFSDKRYRTIPFSQKNFHNISHVDSDKSIAFVDGGNCELVKTPNLSVHFVRVAYVIYKKNEKIAQKREECHVLVKYMPEKDAYSIKFFPAIFEEMRFSSEDPTLKEGQHKASISKMGEIARRFLEISLAKQAIQELRPGDLLIRDGTLQSSVTGEARFLHELYDWAQEKGIVIGAVAKTTTILTKKGNNAVSALMSIAPKNLHDEFNSESKSEQESPDVHAKSAQSRWLYYPSCEIMHPDHLANLYFAKLHDKSRYAFRIEFYQKSRYNESEVFSLLAENSKDAQLPGYPYGLIAVDRLAKVEEREAEVYRMKIIAKLGKELESGLNSMNAHEWF